MNNNRNKTVSAEILGIAKDDVCVDWGGEDTQEMVED